MQKQPIDQRSQGCNGQLVPPNNWLIGNIPAGQHQRWQTRGQQLLQWQAGQHHADKIVPRCHLVGQLCWPRPLPQEDDRPLATFQEPPLLLRHDGKLPGRRRRLNQHGQRFARAVFAAAEFGHRRTGRIADQLKTAKPLHCKDTATGKQLTGDRDGSLTAHSLVRWRLQPPVTPLDQPDLRTTDRAGVGLCMKPSIGRVGILRSARAAHREGRHCCRGPVVRQ